MEWLNYHHLLCVWVVAKQGSIARATEELGLAHPTISTPLSDPAIRTRASNTSHVYFSLRCSVLCCVDETTARAMLDRLGAFLDRLEAHLALGVVLVDQYPRRKRGHTVEPIRQQPERPRVRLRHDAGHAGLLGEDLERQEHFEGHAFVPTVASIIHPLARLGKARAAATAGDLATSRPADQDFLTWWKDADPDLPVLVAATAEYEKLK